MSQTISNHKQAETLLDLKTTILGGWVGGWFPTIVIIRLSQPSLAGAGALAELGKKITLPLPHDEETLLKKDLQRKVCADSTPVISPLVEQPGHLA